MENTVSISHLRKNAAGYLIDIFALLLVYFIPTLSHLTGVPFYLFEPMRIFIILALLHSHKVNAYILALTLPVFSFAIASHPVFQKSLIMTIELTINVFLFYFFVQRKTAAYLSIIISVIVSKSIYYLLKFLFIQFMFLPNEVVSTPIYIQLIVTLVLGLYGFMVSKIIKKDKLEKK